MPDTNLSSKYKHLLNDWLDENSDVTAKAGTENNVWDQANVWSQTNVWGQTNVWDQPGLNATAQAK